METATAGRIAVRLNSGCGMTYCDECRCQTNHNGEWHRQQFTEPKE